MFRLSRVVPAGCLVVLAAASLDATRLRAEEAAARPEQAAAVRAASTAGAPSAPEPRAFAGAPAAPGRRIGPRLRQHRRGAVDVAGAIANVQIGIRMYRR